MGRCKVDGCNKLAKHLGFCSMHYARYHRYGSPYILKKMPNGTNAEAHQLYGTWCGMKDRCLSRTHTHYKDYGGRGIKICDRWLGLYGFWNFVHDMGDKPSYEKTSTGRSLYTLDRINNDGDYCPENCRWASHSEQMNNTRVNRIFTAFGKNGTFTELFRLFVPDGLKKKTAERRFYEAGWPIEEAIITLPWGGRQNG